MALAPFRQLPFAEVPEQPRLAHRWADVTRHDVTITTEELGTCRVAVHGYGQGPPFLAHR